MLLLDYIVIKDTICEQTAIYVPDNDCEDSLDWLCTRAAETYCFSDCTDQEVIKIVYKGRDLRYVGWQPDMLFEFVYDVSGETIWQGYFPSWEH